MRARSGDSLEFFPFRAFGKVMAPPLLTKLDSHKEPGLQIVFTAFDGFLYVVDGATGAPPPLGGAGCLGGGAGVGWGVVSELGLAFSLHAGLACLWLW
jgi:hypothetical protein